MLWARLKTKGLVYPRGFAVVIQYDTATNAPRVVNLFDFEIEEIKGSNPDLTLPPFLKV